MGAPQKALQNAVRKSLRDVERKLRELEREAHALNGERDALLLLAQRHGIELTKPSTKAIVVPKNGKRPTATEALVALLKREPDKLTPRDVINMLEHEIETKAKRPRRLLRATIDLMRRRGRIAADLQGRLSLMPSPHLVGMVTKIS